MTSLVIQDLNVVKKKKTLLSSIDFSVNQGEFIVIMGPSGSGKSTLLRTIAGLESPNRGTIHLNGRDITHELPSKRDMAMVFQNFGLYPHMTVFENISFGLKIRRVPFAEINQKVTWVLELLHLNDQKNAYPHQLSGGQQQRVAMGRAMVRTPQIFLYDEPLSSLDTHLRGMLRQEIKSLHQELATTSLYVTHDFVEAMTMASVLIVLEQGNVVQKGSPKAIYQCPNSLYVAQLLAHYPLNLISMELQNNQLQWPFLIEGTLPKWEYLASNLVNGAVTGVLRAEDIQVASEEQYDTKIRVNFIDEYGADRIVYGTLSDHSQTIVMKTLDKRPKMGDIIPIGIDFSSINCYLSSTGERLGVHHD